MGGHVYLIELTLGGNDRHRMTIYVIVGRSTHDVINTPHFLDNG